MDEKIRKYLLVFYRYILVCVCSLLGFDMFAGNGEGKIVCGYATHSSADEINPQYVNRIIYSYMYIDSTLTNVVLRNPDRLRYVASLREQKPDLQVMASIGGRPGEVSRSLRCDSLRSRVVGILADIVHEYELDGIDVDWEFPGRGDGALTEKEDVANYVRFLWDLRHALGDDKILTIACAGSGYGVDYAAMSEVLDQFNVMCYDMGTPPSHHSALYKSDKVNWLCVEDAMRNFIGGGVPPEKIVLGMPFYGRGTDVFDDFVEWREMELPEGATIEFDEVARVPWIADSEGKMIFTYDSPESLREKCEYIKSHGLAGGMYWRIEQDDANQTLGRTVYESLR